MLIDEILESAHLVDETDGALTSDDFKQAFVVRCQNVFDYFDKNLRHRPRVPSREYPNVAPSMPTMWFEWVASTGSIVDMATQVPRSGKIRLGVLCLATDLRGVNETELGAIRRHFQEHGVALGPETRWCATGFLIWRILEPGKLPRVVGRVDWRVGPEGQLLPSDASGSFVYYLRTSLPETLKTGVSHSLMAAVETCWLALSFMHCRNMRVEKGPPIPDRLQRARRSKGKAPLLRHHTIVIDPTRPEPVPAAGVGGSQPALQALHICRGHFKDFTERGLFGRNRGMYWWGMHARGSKESGVVSKDYRVLPGDGSGGDGGR